MELSRGTKVLIVELAAKGRSRAHIYEPHLSWLIAPQSLVVSATRVLAVINEVTFYGTWPHRRNTRDMNEVSVTLTVKQQRGPVLGLKLSRGAYR